MINSIASSRVVRNHLKRLKEDTTCNTSENKDDDPLIVVNELVRQIDKVLQQLAAISSKAVLVWVLSTNSLYLCYSQLYFDSNVAKKQDKTLDKKKQDEIGCLMEVSIMFDICAYCLFTLYGSVA